MSLHNLSNDALETTSQYLSGVDLLLLYMTGNRDFNARLVRCSFYFRISKYASNRLALSSLPIDSLYRFTSLKHLHLVVDANAGDTERSFLLDLPNTLESLSLVLYNLVACFMVPKTDEYAALPVENGPQTAYMSQTVLNIAKKFPRLRILSLHSSGLKKPSRVLLSWPINLVTRLLQTTPPTLEEFEISPLDNALAKTLLPLLPPATKSCGIAFNGNDPEDTVPQYLVQVPRNVEETEIVLTHYYGVHPAWKDLPTTVKRLRVRLYHCLREPDFFEGLETLPELEVMTLDNASCSGPLVGLPPSLRTLHIHDLSNQEIESPEDAPETQFSMISELPRNLTSLVLQSIVAEWSYVEQFSKLPKTLTYMEMDIDLDGGMGEDSSLGNFNFVSDLSALQTLHVNLHSDDFSYNLLNEENTSGISKPFPASLTDLYWSWGRTMAVNALFFSRLPMGLKHLATGRCITLPSVATSQWPPGIETILMERTTAMQLSKELKEHIPNILTLMPRPPDTLRKLSFSSKTSPFDFPFIDQLPHRLTSLSISFNLSENSMSILPSTLVELKIDQVANFGHQKVKLLPKSLNSLELMSDSSLNDESMSDLPPRLRTLVLSANMHISIVGVSKMPRSIFLLRLPVIGLPNNHYPFKNVFEALNALPPEVHLQCATDSHTIRSWATAAMLARTSRIGNNDTKS